MSSSQLLRCAIENPLTLPLYVKDHFNDLFLPMAGYAASLTVLCHLSQSIFAKIGSRETGAPLAVGFALFCYKFKATQIEVPLQWAAIGTIGYAYAVKSMRFNPLVIAALGAVALTYLDKTGQIPKQETPASVPSFLTYSNEKQNDSRILTMKGYVDRFRATFFTA